MPSDNSFDLISVFLPQETVSNLIAIRNSNFNQYSMSLKDLSQSIKSLSGEYISEAELSEYIESFIKNNTEQVKRELASIGCTISEAEPKETPNLNSKIEHKNLEEYKNILDGLDWFECRGKHYAIIDNVPMELCKSETDFGHSHLYGYLKREFRKNISGEKDEKARLDMDIPRFVLFRLINDQYSWRCKANLKTYGTRWFTTNDGELYFNLMKIENKDIKSGDFVKIEPAQYKIVSDHPSDYFVKPPKYTKINFSECSDIILPAPIKMPPDVIMENMKTVFELDEYYIIKILTWMTCSLFSASSNKILFFKGERGERKTTKAQLISYLMNGQIKYFTEASSNSEFDGLKISLSDDPIVIIDNIEKISTKAKNLLCIAVNKQGASSNKRVLYTDDELMSESYNASIIITGITYTAIWADLTDRMIFIDCKRKYDRYLTIRTLINNYIKPIHGGVLDVIFTAAAKYMERQDGESEERFVVFENIEKELTDMFKINKEDYRDRTLDIVSRIQAEKTSNSTLANLIKAFVASLETTNYQFVGTSAQLVPAIRGFYVEHYSPKHPDTGRIYVQVPVPIDVPQSPQNLTRELMELKDYLEAINVFCYYRRDAHKHRYVFHIGLINPSLNDGTSIADYLLPEKPVPAVEENVSSELSDDIKKYFGEDN